MYHTIEELLRLADSAGEAIWQPVLRNECSISGLDEAEVFGKLDCRYQVMEQSAVKALEQRQETVGELISGIAGAQHKYSQKGEGLCGPFVNRVMALALSSSEVNASMGKICAAPTAGACGILPAVLIGMQEEYKLDRRTVLEGLLTASGIGAVIASNATVSGAEGGCQAECGVAAAMAAAAAVQMRGGTNLAAANAVSFALMNCMGLVCDPVAGLVQVPCAYRNASQAVNALLSADLALAGIPGIIPPDEVVEAMFRVGKMLPMQLRETAMGGIAATPTGKSISKRIFQ